MYKRLTWQKVGSKNVLVVDQKNLDLDGHVAIFELVSNMIPHSGKFNITVILDLSDSKLSTNVMRAAHAAMHRTIGFVHEVIIIADAKTRAYVHDSFSKQSFFELKQASSVEEAYQLINKPTVSASFFTFSKLLGRPNR